MYNFRRWLAGVMYGRYGMDEMNRVLMYIALGCVILGIFVARRWLNLIVLILLAIIYFRMFSRNIYKRQQELAWFLNMKSRFTSRRSPKGKIYKNKGKAGGYTTSGNDGKRILICPYCKDKLRVPVGAGKIKIKCPHCGKQFEEVV